MNVSVLKQQATGNYRGEVVPVEIKFSEKPFKGEPGLRHMEDVVQRMSALVAASTKPELEPMTCSRMGNREEILVVRAYLANLVFEAVRKYEALPDYTESWWKQKHDSPFFALYVFGIFRFGLNIKDLSPLSVRLHKEGGVSNNTFRSLYRKGVEAHRYTPDNTPLAHLGLDQRHWSW